MEIVPEKYLSEMKETAAVIYRHGWGEAFAGNMSIKISEAISFTKSERVELSCNLVNIAEKVFLVTATGSRMRQIPAQEPSAFCSLIKIDGDGTGYFLSGEYPKKPTSELLAHLMIHNENEKKKSNDAAIIHCHPDNVITLLHIPYFKTKEAVNRMLNSVSSEAQILIPEGIGIVNDFNPGSFELAEAIRDEAAKVRIVLMKRHGCISYGKDFSDALDRIEFINKAVRINFEIIKLKQE